MNETLQQWFAHEILVHERALVRFVTRVWPNTSEVDDLCQETYIRVYESAAKAIPLAPRGFLFATARHLMADRIRRDRIVSIEMKGDLESLNVLIDEVSPERRLTARQELWRLAQAFGGLPTKYRELVWMIKVDGLSHKEAALRLGASAKAVERRLARAIRLLEAACFTEAASSGLQSEGADVESESDHG